MQLFSADATVFLILIFFPMKSAQILPKSQFLFHKNLPLYNDFACIGAKLDFFQSTAHRALFIATLKLCRVAKPKVSM